MEQNFDSCKARSQRTANGPCLRERRMFRLLLQSNANYFGTAADDLLPVKIPICCNSYYEEISCVAWDQEAHLMAAMVTLHQPEGYAAGTRLTRAPEHLRFYISLNGGREWQDQGSASVEVENAPCNGDRHYAVSLEPLLSAEELQGAEVMLRVILAWEDIPPPDNPEWKPVFGDVHEVVFSTSSAPDSGEREPLLAAGLSGEHGGAMLAVVRLTQHDLESRHYRHLSFWLEREGGDRLDCCLGSVALSHERAEQLFNLPLDLLDCRWACAEIGTSLGVRLVLSAAPLREGAELAENDNTLRMTKACLTIPPLVTAGAGQIALVGGRSAREIHVAELRLDELEDGEIIVQGVPMPDHDYIVEVSDDGLKWRPLLSSFTVMDRQGNRIRHSPDSHSGQFRYLPRERNVLGILARWDAPEPGKWLVRLRVYMQGVLLPESDCVVVRVGEKIARQMTEAAKEDSGSMAPAVPRDLVLGSLFPGVGLINI
ncbi:hypothetical protein [Thiolapillus brandeum]|nr:hypothetical protein [Thiolapillus brandeum]